MNVKGDPVATVKTISELGFPVTVQHMNDLASQIGEKTLFGRTGGAATTSEQAKKAIRTAIRGLDM